MTVLKLIYIIAASLLAIYGLQALFLTLIARRVLFDAGPSVELPNPGPTVRNRPAPGLQ